MNPSSGSDERCCFCGCLGGSFSAALLGALGKLLPRFGAAAAAVGARRAGCGAIGRRAAGGRSTAASAVGRSLAGRTGAGSVATFGGATVGPPGGSAGGGGGAGAAGGGAGDDTIPGVTLPASRGAGRCWIAAITAS